MEDFELFWDLYNPEPEFNNRRAASRQEWQKRSEKSRKAMLDWLEKNRPPKGRNPYFFVQDFREPRQQMLSYSEYYAKYGTTEEQDGWRRVFQPEKQTTIFIKQS